MVCSHFLKGFLRWDIRESQTRKCSIFSDSLNPINELKPYKEPSICERLPAAADAVRGGSKGKKIFGGVVVRSGASTYVKEWTAP